MGFWQEANWFDEETNKELDEFDNKRFKEE